MERLYALKLKQALPLEQKIELSLARIRDWYEYFHGNVAVSFSGGKDSTVLLDLVRSIYPEVEAVFVNTGLEYPEIVKRVKAVENVTLLRPKMNFKTVIEKFGWPIISKQISGEIGRVNGCFDSEASRELRLAKVRKNLKPKWHFLFDAPFKISDRCCHVLKTGPIKEFGEKTGKRQYIGTLAADSYRRKWAYAFSGGCNVVSRRYVRSAPLSFWTENDILEYTLLKKLPLCSVYGEIIKENGHYVTTKATGTGCLFCCFGLHMRPSPNKFERLAETHPELHKYVMEKLGLGEVLAWLRENVPGRLREKFKDGLTREARLF
jgi:3'-phosphoadenosine 5'-phosphosulfate sulfotransferase (PAPS reductase)/FAD synthetase